MNMAILTMSDGNALLHQLSPCGGFVRAAGAGGETDFPVLGVTVTPRKGTALLGKGVSRNGEFTQKEMDWLMQFHGDFMVILWWFMVILWWFMVILMVV